VEPAGFRPSFPLCSNCPPVLPPGFESMYFLHALGHPIHPPLLLLLLPPPPPSMNLHPRGYPGGSRAWLATFENRLHEGLRKHFNTPQRVALLAGACILAFLVAIYLPQLLTGEATFKGARDVCRDGTCRDRFDELWYTRGSGGSIVVLSSRGGSAEADDFTEAKNVCRRPIFCEAINLWSRR
jgi:hypothetical protein